MESLKFLESLRGLTKHSVQKENFPPDLLPRAAQQFKGETRTQMEMVAGIITTPSLDAPLSEVMRYW